MVVDTSALIAILTSEHDAERFVGALQRDSVRLISAATLTEAGCVAVAMAGEGGGADLDDLVAELGLEVVPFGADHARLAREAWLRFGKGRHPARLNLGDCFSYALAKAAGEPLLFKGNDFSRTDLQLVALEDGPVTPPRAS